MYEYKEIPHILTGDNQRLIDTLNKYGEQGWRVVRTWTTGTAIVQVTLLLERTDEDRKKWAQEEESKRIAAYQKFLTEGTS